MITLTKHAKSYAQYRLLSNASIVDGCWVWSGATNNDGYGVVSLNGKMWMTHRLAYVAWRRPIKDGLLVCHSCDNPACINPEHLWTGTHSDNSLDMVAKGRSRGAR